MATLIGLQDVRKEDVDPSDSLRFQIKALGMNADGVHCLVSFGGAPEFFVRRGQVYRLSPVTNECFRKEVSKRSDECALNLWEDEG